MMIELTVYGFKDDEYLTTYKIFNDFGARTAVWKLDQSKPLEE